MTAASNVEWKTYGDLDYGASHDYARGLQEWALLREHLRQYGLAAHDSALEIGCGGGAFSRLLAGRAESVLALDLSPGMIRLARGRSEFYPNVDYVNADVLTYKLPEGEFDFVATLTTIHHMPAEVILEKVKESLKPGGVFVCLDLYRRSNVGDLLFDCAAYPADIFLRLWKTGRPRALREVREAYDEHGKTDTYLTLREVRRVCAGVLPGALVRRHLFWRYSVVWKKPVPF